MDAYSGLDTIPRSRSDYDTFEDVTIYTSLESCSQCAGMMALARVKEVVYLQTDPGMYNIGNMLYNLTRKIPSVKESKGALQAPYPIFGSQLGIEACKLLDNAFHLFHKEVPNKPFFIPKNGHPPDKSQSITSFLCTDIAYDIFGSGADELADFKVVHGSYIPKSQRCPTDEVCGPAVCGALDNVATLKRAKQFYQYATRAGKRGTPHP
jgi:hypothetical protein